MQFNCRFVRAVAYRWLAKWLFGCMGWENTRPLPACLSHDLRNRYGSTHVQGYESGQERANTAYKTVCMILGLPVIYICADILNTFCVPTYTH